MTTVRSLFIAMVAVALLIGARPIAGIEQYPRGLMMSADPRGGGSNSRCTIETRPMSFGSYNSLAETDVDAVAQIIYFCTRDTSGGGGNPGGGNGPGTQAQNKGLRIEMDQGLANSFQPRGMGGASRELLGYNIYLDATHRTVWGTGQHTTEVYIDLNPPIGTPVTVVAYGRIFRGQDVSAGNYTDQVGVRIEF